MEIKILFLFLCLSGFAISASDFPIQPANNLEEICTNLDNVTNDEIAALQKDMAILMDINSLDEYKGMIMKAKAAYEKLKLMQESIQKHNNINVNEVMECLDDLDLIKKDIDERNYAREIGSHMYAICGFATNKILKYKDLHKINVIQSQIALSLYFYANSLQNFKIWQADITNCKYLPYRMGDKMVEHEADEIIRYGDLWLRKIPLIEDPLCILNELCQNPEIDPGSVACFLKEVFYKEIDDNMFGLACIIDGIDKLKTEIEAKSDIFTRIKSNCRKN